MTRTPIARTRALAACTLALALAPASALADGASEASSAGTQINTTTVPFLASVVSTVQSGVMLLGGIVAVFGLISFGGQLATRRGMELNEPAIIASLAAVAGGVIMVGAAVMLGSVAADPSTLTASGSGQA